MAVKVCRICNLSKPLNDFHFRLDNNKYRTECKDCRNNKEAARRYSVSVETIEKLKESQHNRCAICHIHSSEIPHVSFKSNPLVIDHNHLTGEIRGLLCPTCNSGLGHFKDNIEMLESAAQYLRNRVKI